MLASRRPDKKPRRELLIVTPVWGAYDVVADCCRAVDENTVGSFYHVLVDDNHTDSIFGRFSPSENRTIISVKNDPVGFQHVEQIGKMMDLGLAWGKTALSWKYFVKLESDCIVNSHWDTILLDEMSKYPDALGIEAFSVDTELGQQPQVPEQHTYPKDWTEQNCILFSPLAMNHTWSFSAWPHAIDQHLSRYLRTLTDECTLYETTKTWITHYRSSSRKDYA